MRPRPRRPPFPLAARRQPTLPRRRLIAFAKVARHDCSFRCRCQLKIFWGLSPLPTSAGGGAPHALTAAGGRSAMNAAAAAAAESLCASPVAPLPDARGTVGCCTPTEARAASVRGPGVHANWATGAGLDTAVIVVVIWVNPADRHSRAPARSRSKKARSRAAESAEGWVPWRGQPPRLRAPLAPLRRRQQGAKSTRNKREHQQTEKDVTRGRDIEAAGLVRSEGRSKRRGCPAVRDLRGGGHRLRRYDCGHRASKERGTLNGTRRRRRASLVDEKMSPRAWRGRVSCRRRLSQP